jgi:hypothetical protein
VPLSPQHPTRRSTRINLQLAVSLQPASGSAQAILANTHVINAHGCGVIAPRAFERGTEIDLAVTATGKFATGRVVDVICLTDSGDSWLLGVAFDSPGNYWGVPDPPEDWAPFRGEQADPAPKQKKIAPPAAPQPPAPLARPAAAKADPLPAPPKAPAAKPRTMASRLCDFSPGACYLETHETIPTGSCLKLAVKLGEVQFPLRGIARAHYPGKGIAVEFAERTQKDRSLMEALMAALRTAGAPVEVLLQAVPNPDNAAELRAPANEAATDPLLDLVRRAKHLSFGEFQAALRTQRAAAGNAPKTRGQHA